MILKLKIDCSKIDKSKLFTGKNGAKYLDATVLIKDDGEVDQYGNNGMIVQDVSKEDRAAGKKGAILGNSKPMGQQPQPAAASKPALMPTVSEDPDDLPF
jgi:hypothetical protein